MRYKTSRMRGFTLIASLLVLILLSGVAIGVMFLVNSQQHVGGNDLEANLAYYGAESGMEKLTSDLASLYSLTQAPTQAAISNLATLPPTLAMVGPMNYVESISQQTVGGVPVQRFNTISSGPEQNLYALTIPMNLQVQATRPSGASVNMFRTVEVALIPVFQFGVFSDSDLSYFAGPQFSFRGRIHTNGNLFLAADPGPLVTDAKITAFGEIIRDRLANNWTGGGYQGSVFVPNQTNGCSGGAPAAQCLDFGPDTNTATNDASWSGGIPPAGAANADPTYAAWIAAAKTFNGFILNRINGAKKLTLPFVQGNNAAIGTAGQQIQIIRRAVPTDTVSVANSKLYNKAAIRVLLADTEALLVADRPFLIGDLDNIDLTAGGVAVSPDGRQIQVNGVNYTRVAMANVGQDVAWTAAPLTAPSPLTIPDPAGAKGWNLINGWLRVEYLDNAAPTPGWNGVTREWLGYGFARGTNVPTTPSIPALPTGNTAHPNAILILQELKNAAAPVWDAGAGASQSEYSWYPINFWDPREGLPRDNNGALAGTQCNVNGVMDAVELDVGNLNLWLQHLGIYGGGRGNLVNSTSQNGYVLYFWTAVAWNRTRTWPALRL